MGKSDVKHQPELSPARVAGSVSRGSTRDVDVTDGTFCHLWGEGGTKWGHAVMSGSTFSSVWSISHINELFLSCIHSITHVFAFILSASIPLLLPSSRAGGGTVLVPSVKQETGLLCSSFIFKKTCGNERRRCHCTDR